MRRWIHLQAVKDFGHIDVNGGCWGRFLSKIAHLEPKFPKMAKIRVWEPKPITIEKILFFSILDRWSREVVTCLGSDHMTLWENYKNSICGHPHRIQWCCFQVFGGWSLALERIFLNCVTLELAIRFRLSLRHLEKISWLDHVTFYINYIKTLI